MSERTIATRSQPVIAVSSTRVVAQRHEGVAGERTARAAWDERNWLERHSGAQTIYEGDYVVRDAAGAVHRFPGRVEVTGSAVNAYVANPPTGLRRHAKASCFQIVDGGPWYRCNWYIPARNQDDAILYVERVLSEAVRR